MDEKQAKRAAAFIKHRSVDEIATMLLSLSKAAQDGLVIQLKALRDTDLDQVISDANTMVTEAQTTKLSDI